MDITIPPYNLKRFTASIACLGKIGKDLYLSFDPLDGLTLSSLNEAKSAYGKFHFDSGFFERCSAPTVGGAGQRTAAGATSNNNGGGEGNDDELFYDTRYVCRVPVRSVHSILRQRKGVVSLRIRSEGMDGEGNHFGLNRRKKRRGRHNGDNGGGESGRGRSRSRHRRGEDGGDEDDDGDEERRGSYSARERSRSRKRRKQQSRLKRRKDNNNDDQNNDDDTNQQNSGISQNTDKMMLSFEFYIERPSPKDMHGNYNANATNNPNAPIPNGGVFRVLHKVGVTDANGITLSASVTQRATRSEIISAPKSWLRLLDPLRRTAEVALTIDDEVRVVTATSFHPGEQARQSMAQGGDEGNAVLQAAAARNALLKTETSTGVEEFDEYDFRNNRGKKKKKRGGDNDEEGRGSDNDDDEEEGDDYEKESDRPPLDVNEKVILVFSIKEAKAMLQYCASNSSSSTYDDYDEGVILSFHWGGRPIVIETDGDYFSGELVLATLHHGMIASNITVGGNGGGGGSGRRVSPGGERD